MNIKEMFERLEEAKAEFARTHEKLTCFHCEADITPGKTFYSNTMDDVVFCSHECALAHYDVAIQEFDPTDDEYTSWFPEKLEV